MTQQFIVTAADSPEGGLEGLAKRLTEGGMKVERIQPYGVITGRIPAGSVAALKAMKDVLDVAQERTFQAPPPDSPIQ